MTPDERLDATHQLEVAKSSRLAGNKRFAVRFDEIELSLRKGSKGSHQELVAYRAAAIKACVNCKGLQVDEQNYPDTFVREFRLRCGREKSGAMLTCDDDLKVFVNSDMSLSLSSKPAVKRSAADWSHLLRNSMTITDKSYDKDYDWALVDEYAEMEREKSSPSPSKDVPKTTGVIDDAW